MLATTEIAYQARSQFIPFHKRTQRFACLVCHRRAGKTVACVHDLLDGALRCELTRPRFAYVAPLRNQAKAVAWDYLRAGVSPLLDLGAQINESELRVDLHNGGQVRLFGADNVDALRGLYLDGIVLDEYASMDPRIAQVIGPALADRKGWAVYIGTPKGHNDFYKVHQQSKDDPDWFSMTLKASETGLLDPKELELWKRNLSDAEYRQEFECDFEAAVVGSYYGSLLALAEADGRICGVPYDHAARVWTAWDLGFRDATAIWFCQVIGKELHIIDFYQSVGALVEQDVRTVLDKPYNYAGHILPHDAQATSKQTGRTTKALMESLGLRDTQLCPDHRIEDGISNVQITIPKCWFDKTKTAEGLECLKLYRAEFDDKLKTLKRTPLHDYTSHAADAFRYLAMGIDGVRRTAFNKPIVYPRAGVA